MQLSQGGFKLLAPDAHETLYLTVGSGEERKEAERGKETKDTKGQSNITVFFPAFNILSGPHGCQM